MSSCDCVLSGLLTTRSTCPGGEMPDLAIARGLVEPLGPNVGILVDTFHFHRQTGGPDFDLLSAIPGERIGFVQIGDTDGTPVTADDGAPIDARLLPGDGVVDFERFFGVLSDIGADPFIATE